MQDPSRIREVRVAAAMLNAMNKEASKNILTTLEESNPDLGNSIKQKMFTFEDLIYLDAQDVQKILRDVDMKDLALAMKNVPENLVSFILSCMSKRAGEGVLEEMEFLTNAKAKDIEAAQLNVVETVRRLESDDEIDLSVMEVANNGQHRSKNWVCVRTNPAKNGSPQGYPLLGKYRVPLQFNPRAGYYTSERRGLSSS